MSRLLPRAILLATLLAVVAVIASDAPTLIVFWGMPALLGVLASERGRALLARRLLFAAPLVALAVLLRWFEQAPTRDWLPPALRVASAVAWSSCLSTLLPAPKMRAALSGLGAPVALIELISHTRRFAVQLAATTGEVWSAATLRAGLHSLRSTAGTVGQVAGVIVVRAFDRAETVAIAGALRGTHLGEEAFQASAFSSDERISV